MSKLGDFAKIQGGYAYKSTDFQSDGNACVVKIKNIRFGDMDYSDVVYISDELAQRTENWRVKAGDILISMTGSGFNAPASLVGRVARVKANEPLAYINQRVGRIVVLDKIDPRLVYYFLSQKNIQEILVSNATGSANQVNINSTTILDLDFPNIDFEESVRIADILDGLDQKIQLNTQINQTLEQIAQTIFRSWFIDFDPVYAKAEALAGGQTAEQATQAAMAVISGKNTQELHRLQTANPEQYQQLWEIAEAFPSGVDEEGVPWGWKYEKSENLFDVGIGKTPPRKEPEWFSESSNDIEWISIKDMGNSAVFVNRSSEYLLESAVNKFNVKRIPENTVILSFKLTVGRVGITTKETTTNEAIAHFRLCDKSYLTTEFLYLYLKNFDFNNLGSTSSIATAVNSKTIKEMEVLYPTLEIINAFQYRVLDIFKKIRANSEQNNCLERIRDELLPKLLSGEVVV